LTQPLTFKKAERLCDRRIIGLLYTDRENNVLFKKYPLVIILREEQLPESVPAQVLISVPRKKIRKAHDRIKLKRRLRELYRTSKHELYELMQDKQYALALAYTSSQKLPYSKIQESFTHLKEELKLYLMNHE